MNRQAGNQFGLAQDLTPAQFHRLLAGQYERSAELAQQALDLARRMHNRRGMALALDGVGAALARLRN